MRKQLFTLYFNIFLRNWPCYPSITSLFKRFRFKGGILGVLVAAFALSQMVISPFGGTGG